MFNYSFVDWDNTLYDTMAFEADIFAIFFKFGVAESHIKETFQRSLCTVSPYQYDYTFEEHAQFLRELGYNIPNTAEAELNALFLKDYLFSDAVAFLDFLKKNSKNLILLSAGDKKFQLNKIKNSKIYKKFDEVVIVDGEKEKYLLNRCKNERVLFVNDNLRENESVKNAMPSTLLITKLNSARNSEEDASRIKAPYFLTLTNIKQYVEQQLG
jgi:FMN phosphatase YigB (HAD superfamily)